MVDAVIRDAISKDIPKIKRLCDDRMGAGYFNSIPHRLDRKNTSLRVIEYNKAVVGFCYSYVCLAGDAARSLRIDLSILPAAENQQVGVLKTIVVHPDYSGKGLGTLLIRDAFYQMQLKKASLAVTPAWDSGNAAFGNIFQKQGFRLLTTIPAYWTDDSIEKGYHCPACGHPCRCSVNMYIKRF